MTRVVIVGAGFAGLSAARALKKENLEVVLVDRTNHHLFQALLYQVASAGLSPAEVATPIRALLGKQSNVSVRMGEVTQVLRDERVLVLDGQTRLEYDYLILAVGVQSSYFGHPEWAAHAPGLKSAAEAVEIRESVLLGFEKAEGESDPARREKLMTTVVVGGGPTGVELAGAFAELRRHVLRWDFRQIRPEQARVVLIESGERVLSGYSSKLSASARKHLESLGVELWLGEPVELVEEGRVATRSRSVEAQTVVWTAGVQATELTRALPSEHDRVGRVQIAPDLRLSERIYCAGDMTSLNGLPGMAPVAMAQGVHAARNVLREIKGQAPLPFRYREREHIATLGRSAAVFQWGSLQLTGLLAWLAWLWLHLFRIADLQNRALVFARWTWSYLTWKWGVRLIIGRDKNRP